MEEHVRQGCCCWHWGSPALTGSAGALLHTSSWRCPQESPFPITDPAGWIKIPASVRHNSEPAELLPDLPITHISAGLQGRNPQQCPRRRKTQVKGPEQPPHPLCSCPHISTELSHSPVLCRWGPSQGDLNIPRSQTTWGQGRGGSAGLNSWKNSLNPKQKPVWLSPNCCKESFCHPQPDAAGLTAKKYNENHT